jgi:hypothetical protein
MPMSRWRSQGCADIWTMMSGYSTYHLVLAIAATAAVAADRPAPSAIRPEPIARAARHPGPLLVREKGIGEIARTYGTPVWAASVSAADGSFAPMRIILLDGRSSLAAQLEKARASPQDYEAEVRHQAIAGSDDGNQAEALRQLARLRTQGPLVRLVPLTTGRRGYAAVLGVGRDTTRIATVLPSPDARYEVVITVDAPFQREAATMTPELGRYRTRLSDEPLETAQEMAMVVYRQLFPPARKRLKSN